MGVITNERKRNHHSYTVACKIPALVNSDSSSSASKRSRLFTSSNQAHDSPMQEEARVSVVSRFHQYPDLKSQIKRETHAPVRPSKIGGFQNSKSSGLESVSSDRVNWRNEKLNLERLNRAKEEAIKTLRYVNKDSDVELKSKSKREPHASVGPSKFGGFRNSMNSGLKSVSSWTNEKINSLTETERLHRAKVEAYGTLRYVNKDHDVVEIKDDDDEVVEVVNVEREPSGDSIIEMDEIMVVDKEFKALLSSPAVRNVGFDNTKVDNAEKRFESLSQSEKKLNLCLYWANVEALETLRHVNNDHDVVNMKEDSAEKMFESLSLSEKKDDLGLLGYKNLLSDLDRKYKKLDSLKFQVKINEKTRVALQQFRPQRNVELEAEDTKETFRKEMMKLAFKPLTKDEVDQVTTALSSHQWRKLLVTHESSNIDITVELLQCLRPRMWLNDEVVNLYLELLKEREKREPKKFLKCHFFNTFFFKKLTSGKDGYNYQSVRRWTSQRKLGYFISDCDKIFVPIHNQIHWCLAVINITEEKFQYLDSLGHADPHVLKVLPRYFADEVKDKNGKEIDVSSWKREFVENLPQQKNGFDCGVFMIKYADFYSRDIGLCFGQEHMPYFRQRTTKEILNLKAE